MSFVAFSFCRLSKCNSLSNTVGRTVLRSLSVSLSVIFLFPQCMPLVLHPSLNDVVSHPLAVCPGTLLFSVLDSYCPLGQSRDEERRRNKNTILTYVEIFLAYKESTKQ